MNVKSPEAGAEGGAVTAGMFEELAPVAGEIPPLTVPVVALAAAEVTPPLAAFAPSCVDTEGGAPFCSKCVFSPKS